VENKLFPNTSDFDSNIGSKSVIFEAFEASATSEQVLATEDALEWNFPGQAVAMPYDVFSSEDFQHSLSKFLQQASLETIKEFSAVTYKACAPLPEIRDTPDPTLITGALMTILEVNGSLHETTLLRKRVRDTVSFYKAHKPWRRSAFYLVLRVAVQRHLYQLLGVDKGRMYFKIIMCIFFSNLLHDGIDVLPDEKVHALRQKLGRRLAKLELDQERGTKEARNVHREVFRTLRSIMEKSLTTAAHHIESQWDNHKRRTNRFIWPIQQYASFSDTTLKLTRSAQMLHVAMYSHFRHACMWTERQIIRTNPRHLECEAAKSFLHNCNGLSLVLILITSMAARDVYALAVAPSLGAR
jgi:hypothetical protein